ncbi:Pentatricopeptide repeat [Dillenia turbinata]|uniref:Pentatricopeptide repeat n=1 Tax=Dillenia turbinata TaxID=194707 RepID=A0AAN8VDK4_9MAGN
MREKNHNGIQKSNKREKPLQILHRSPELIQAHILKLGLQTNSFVLTQFVSKSSNLNAIDYAPTFIFEPESDSSLYDTFLFNTIIRAYARSAAHSKHKALYFYNLMLSYGVLPNNFTYPVVLKACAGLADLNLGKSLHGCVVKYGFDDDLHVQNTLIHMYCGCDGGIAFARKVFDGMPVLDFVSWSAMIGGYARLRHLDDVLKLFGKMTDLGIRPEEHTLVSLLSACGNLGELEIGKWVASYIEMERFETTLDLSNALIDMFSKCGDVDEALRLFRNMNVLSVVSLTSVLVGLGMHGRGVEAVSLFEEMKESGMVPDDVLFIGLLSACSHSGLIEQGKHYFDQMLREFKIVPKIEHYGCMVDMFCRAGLVGEALQFVRNMPVEPNPIIARILVDACRAHGKHELGLHVFIDPPPNIRKLLLKDLMGLCSSGTDPSP